MALLNRHRHADCAAPMPSQQERANGSLQVVKLRRLTTIDDRNSIGIRPTPSEESNAQVPGSRHNPTSWTYLTSEGSDLARGHARYR